jgi:hypothetical protein
MESVKPPRTGIRIGIGLQVVSVIAIYAMANYLGFFHYERRDFSRSQRFALAGQTREVLKEFKKPLGITVVASPTFFSPVAPILGDLRGLLNEVVFAKREGVRVEYVDPVRNPTRMQDLKAKYNLSGFDNLVIIESDGRHRTLEIAEMGEFDMSPVAAGGAPVLQAFRGEQALTSALIGLLKPDKEKVYFLEGHGEAAAAGEMSDFLEAIGRQNAKIERLSLAARDTVPEDASAIVLAGARNDLDEREASVLAAWLRQGGRMLMLLDPNAETPRLRGLAASAGIVPRNDRVLRLIELPFATGILRDVTGQVLPNTEVVRRLDMMNILFPGATQSLGADPKLAESEKILVRPLVQAAEEFWGETDYAPNQPGGVSYEDGVDFGQPIVIAAAADRDGVEDDRLDIQSSRLIVVGSVQFAMNASLTKQGLDFLVGCVNSLIDRESVSGVLPKTVSRFALNLTQEQMSQLALVVMVGVPAGAAALGFLVWLRRRK